MSQDKWCIVQMEYDLKQINTAVFVVNVLP